MIETHDLSEQPPRIALSLLTGDPLCGRLADAGYCLVWTFWHPEDKAPHWAWWRGCTHPNA